MKLAQIDQLLHQLSDTLSAPKTAKSLLPGGKFKVMVTRSKSLSQPATGRVDVALTIPLALIST